MREFEGVKLRQFEARDLDWLVEAHAELYARTEGFDDSFAFLVSAILTDFLDRQDTVWERGWVAERDGWRLGSIFCVKSEQSDIAKLRLFLVQPEAQGMGLGKHLLETCMGFARDRGYVGMHLWTHESHTAACALYEAYGFEMTAAEPVRNFGVDLVEQTWKISF
ncbi:ribosomal protein S18 acetylase RimI-like enzyme [Shimia isoporae]|uniref:Ribosomal protein S18 acetylase RimI-like enzyme n=1 Tax=Shimia isoporae TaxID=647720 RepID=A0A4R1NPW6_9RHOB|nr:ribosomal protein S18 acetylase RimI-like enzyme [Shimia isoporae]